jgi:PPOX class probable F420-dependent enzyme
MLDPSIRDLACGANFAALTVIPANGHPMTHIMWIDADDDHILVNTDLGRAKATAMNNDPRVTVAIWDAANPYRYAEVRGRVVGTTTGEEAGAHIDALAMKYTGAAYSFGSRDTRIIYRIEPIRQRGL